jgi:uncharacterized membrane protein YphA (DoxX/SURF4 family)
MQLDDGRLPFASVAVTTYAIPTVELMVGAQLVLGLFLRPALVIGTLLLLPAYLRLCADAAVGHRGNPTCLYRDLYRAARDCRIRSVFTGSSFAKGGLRN